MKNSSSTRTIIRCSIRCGRCTSMRRGWRGVTNTLLEWDAHIPSFDEVHAEALKANRFIQPIFMTPKSPPRRPDMSRSRPAGPARRRAPWRRSTFRRPGRQLQSFASFSGWLLPTIRRPLSGSRQTQRTWTDGRPTSAVVQSFIKPQ